MKRQIRTEVVINAGKEKVWNTLTNFTDYPKWNPFIKSIKGQLEAGKKLTNLLVIGNKEYTFKPVIKSVMPYKKFAWLGSMGIKGIFDGYHFFEIEEISASQVKLIHGENFSGILSGYIYYKIGTATLNGFISMNQALKEQAEGNLS